MKFEPINRIDLRALAWMRMATAFTLLLDLCIRATDLRMFYSDSGIVPVRLILNMFWDTPRFSFHILSGSVTVQIFLFSLSALFAFFLLIGYRTQLFTVLSWIMLVSLHNRNPIILQGGDDLLRLILFWGIFLPWGKFFSIDQRINQESPSETSVSSVVSLAYLLQICYVYGISALEKGKEWNTDFTALYYIYHLDQIDYRLATFLGGFPLLLKFMTALAYYFELLVPLLILSPVKTVYTRALAVLLIIGFHVWNGLTLQIGLFYIIGISSSLGMIPTLAMNWLSQKLNKAHAGWEAFLSACYDILDRARLVNNYQFAFSKTDGYKSAIKYIMAFVTIYVFAWNWSNLSSGFSPYVLNDQARLPGYFLHLDQNWGMFAPGVIKEDGWYIYEGITVNGDTLDLKRNGSPVNFSRPERMISTYQNDRWRKYGEQFMLSGNSPIREYLCRSVFNDWNAKHPENKIRQVQILYMLEFTLPDYKKSVPERTILSVCY